MSSELEILTQEFVSQKVPIVFQKDCGYRFLGFFCKDDSVSNLYDYVDRVFNHIGSPSSLYIGEEYIERTDTPVKDIIRNITPLYPMPERVVYSFLVRWT